MSTHNIGFYENSTKIEFQLSSNTHLISSAEALHTTKTDQSGHLLCLINLPYLLNW